MYFGAKNWKIHHHNTFVTLLIFHEPIIIFRIKMFQSQIPPIMSLSSLVLLLLHHCHHHHHYQR